MKKYYGLRLMAFFYHTLAVVIALVSISSIGFILVDHLTGGGTGMDWVTRAVGFLAGGGLAALTCYVIGQLLESQVETLKAVYVLHAVLPELEQIKNTNVQILKQLQTQKTMLNSLGALAPADHEPIDAQLKERRRRIEAE